MTRDYTSYLMNKVNQYKDSDALRLSGLGLATLSWKGISGFTPQYWISNMSLTDLVIKEIIGTYTVSDNIFEVNLQNGVSKQLWSGFWNNSPATWNEDNFSGSVADRTVSRGSPPNDWWLEWLHGGSSTQYGTTMTVKFTNGTQLFAEAPGYMNTSWHDAPGNYVRFRVASYWGTNRVIEKITLDWPASNVALMQIEIEGKNHFYDDMTLIYPSTFGPGGFEFVGTIDDRTLEPSASFYTLSFFFAGATADTGYAIDVWYDNGEHDYFERV